MATHVELLKYFDEDNSDDILVFTNKPEAIEALKGLLPEHFRQCFVSDKILKEHVENFAGTSEREILADNYIPDTPSIMSGDFGEIFGYLFLIDKYIVKYSLRIKGPKKWRYKSDKNIPSPKTDIVLFWKNESPSKEDLIIAAETKMKATANSRDVINDALGGIKKDYTSRLAKSLVWLRSRAVKKNKVRQVKYINRFINSVKPENGEYTKHFKAIALLDKDFLEDELDKDIEIVEIGDDLKIIVLAIDELKDLYEAVYEGILEASDDGCVDNS